MERAGEWPKAVTGFHSEAGSRPNQTVAGSEEERCERSGGPVNKAQHPEETPYLYRGVGGR